MGLIIIEPTIHHYLFTTDQTPSVIASIASQNLNGQQMALATTQTTCNLRQCAAIPEMTSDQIILSLVLIIKTIQ